MTAKPFSLQDQFLNSARRSKVPVTVFLLKGVKLQGVLTWFDPFSMLLRRDGQAQLVYKHSISTILPAKALDTKDWPPPDTAEKSGLQDIFLSAAEKEEQSVTMFLVNGVMLEGQVRRHDQFSLLLERGGEVQIVYKHAISTIQPSQPLTLNGESAAGEGEE